jgi:hypothetical protein
MDTIWQTCSAPFKLTLFRKTREENAILENSNKGSEDVHKYFVFQAQHEISKEFTLPAGS